MKEKTQREIIAASITSRSIILTLAGEEIPAHLDLLKTDLLKSNPPLAAMLRAELSGGESNRELPSINAMRRLELVDYEPASDKGHFRFYPKGAVVFDLIKAWAEEIAIGRLQAYNIETPIIYSWGEPDIRAQAESFHEHHYIVHPLGEPEKEFILRFAGDFGLFRIMRDAQLTYKHLPVRLFEFAPSFRYENSGSLTGLKRLRAFWMPDIHSFCTDLGQGLTEYKELYCRYTDLANGTGIKYAIAFRIVESFYQENKPAILEMIQYSGVPVFIELLSDMKHYWVMKHEINSIDGNDGVCQVSTVQLDIKDASLYGITYVDQNGAEKGCTIVHSSIGSIERWVFSILEDALKNKVPSLPLWLAPIQVRILPVSDKHENYCLEIAKLIRQQNVRADVDDRASTNTLSWRIRAAEREWIPYVVIVGDKEMGSENKTFSVRVRGAGQQAMDSGELVSAIHEKTKGMPFRQFPGISVAKRPVFRGGD